MDEKSIKQMIINLLIIPKDWTKEKYESESRKLDKYFNSYKVLDNIEITDDDFKIIEINPSIENKVIENIFTKLKFINSNVKREDIILKKLNSNELLELFKKGFNPYNLVSSTELEKIIQQFNYNFIINNYFEILFDRFNHDEIYENPNEFDSQILELINNNMKV